MTRHSDERIALNDLAGGGLTAFSYADGSCGIRGVDGATALPSAITLAASFDVELAEEYGRVLGDEVLAAGHNTLLAPAMDIARDPRSGRIGENLGEDPLLAGELGGRMGRGIQSRGALAVAKHYVGNNVERLRTGEGPLLERTPAIDVRVDHAALHEVYLAPFRRAVCAYAVAGLLGSYNRLNGEYVCQSPELMRLPRDEWGFTGVTIPDFLFAVRDAAAALEAGLDIAGLDELAGRTEQIVHAADDDLLRDLGAHVRAAAAQVGLKPATGAVDRTGLATPSALALAERVATEGSILLRNSGVLPFAAGTRIALVGGDDVAHRLVVGGAASVRLPHERMPSLDDAFAEAGIEIAAGAAGIGNVPLTVLAREDGFDIEAVVTDADGSRTHALSRAELRADENTPDAAWSADLRITLPPSGDDLVVTAEFAGEVALDLDGEVIATGFREASPMVEGPHYVLQARIPRHPDSPAVLTVRYRTGPAIAIPGTPIVPHLSVGAASLDSAIAAAVAAVDGVDAVVVLAGRVTGEAMDAEELTLPAGQPELIEALAATGVPVVVVTHGAGPIIMTWRDRVAAILHAGHPGERHAPALAAILSGRVEPGGRLPLTVPAGAPPIPVADPDAHGVLRYDEGVDIGYRGYERQGVEPAYWFGYGLGYADIDIVDAHPNRDAVDVTLRCSSARGGKAVVQLYSRPDETSTAALVGIAVARLAAGEERVVQVTLDTEALARRRSDTWVRPPSVTVDVGFSRGDLRARVDMEATRASASPGRRQWDM